MGIFIAILISIFPVCAEESDSFCYWDAQKNGNGIGNSFIALDNSVIYL